MDIQSAVVLKSTMALGAIVFTAIMPVPVQAAEYPTKPITIIAASPPGGAVDLFSRIIGRHMEKEWGQAVVVLNKSGGGGGIGIAQLKTEAPDGYTFGVSNSDTWSKNWQHMEKPNYTVDDFAYVSSFAGGGCAWVTRAESPYKTWKDIIAAAKSGKSLSFGAFSTDNKLTLNHVGRRDGIKFKTVTYKGISEILPAVLGGHVDFGFSGGSHAQYVKKGTLRVLVATDEKRAPDSPDVPTLREMGYGVSNCAFFMIAAPKGTPGDIVDKVEAAIARGMKTEEMKKYLDSRETTAMVLKPAELARRLKQDAQEYAVTLKATD